MQCLQVGKVRMTKKLKEGIIDTRKAGNGEARKKIKLIDFELIF